MSTKLTDMICYRLDSELKAKLLAKLDKEHLSLSSFHRNVVETVLVDTGHMATMLELVERGS